MNQLIRFPGLICFFLFLLTGNVIAQQQRSYIQDGDTRTLDVKLAWVEGWRPYYECVILSKDGSQILTAKDIDGYQTTWSGPFISYQVSPDEWVFLEILEKGELELYRYIDQDFKSHFYVKRFDEDTFYELTDRRRRSIRTLKDLWTSCDKFKKLIDDIKLNENGLKRLISAHNDCNYVHIPKIRKSIGGGISSMRLFFSPSRGYDSVIPGGILSSVVTKGRQISYVVEANLSMPIQDSDASFYTGLVLNNWKYYDFSFVGLGDVTYFTDINIMDISIPLGLQYTWPKRKLRPFIIGNFAPHFVISDGSSLTSEVLTPTDGLFIFTSDQDLSTIGYSGGLAFGVSYHLSDDQIVYVKVGNMTRFNAQKPWVFNVNSFYFTAGYSF